MTHPFTRSLIPRRLGLGALLLSLFTATVIASTYTYSQTNTGNSLRGRLSPMPVTAATVRTITGSGEARAVLNGSILTISGEFQGMSSAATMAHIHHGPRAIPGPVVLRLDVTNASSGSISGTLTLTPELITALHAESLYVQIHSETNPEGELRGWLMH
jgi:hypothetical protein